MAIFGPPSLVRTSFVDGFRLGRMFRGFFRYRVPDPTKYINQSPPDRVIAHLEPRLEQEPRNWLLRYTLGDWYSRAKRYRDSLHVLLDAYKLRPKDPRSTFALATTYRILARANIEGVDLTLAYPQFNRMRAANPALYGQNFDIAKDYDPKASADELQRLNMTIDEVAQKAMELFEETLRLGVRADERKFVEVSLQSMYSEFPHLEAKVKARRRTDTGLFGPARSGGAGILNEATEHFARLRNLTGQRPRYKYELGEVIRLCQWAVAADGKLGDAYVLLANGYAVLDGEVSSSGDDKHIYLRWAASILQHWADTPLRNFPFTKNAQIGRALYDDVFRQLATLERRPADEVMQVVRARTTQDLAEALSPATFDRVRKDLENEPIKTQDASKQGRIESELEIILRRWQLAVALPLVKTKMASQAKDAGLKVHLLIDESVTIARAKGRISYEQSVEITERTAAVMYDYFFSCLAVGLELSPSTEKSGESSLVPDEHAMHLLAAAFAKVRDHVIGTWIRCGTATTPEDGRQTTAHLSAYLADHAVELYAFGALLRKELRQSYEERGGVDSGTT